MYKITKMLLFVLFGITISYSSSFLNPNQAFKINVEESSKSIDISVKLGKDIYIYEDKFLIFLNGEKKQILNSEIALPKSLNFHNSQVYANDFNLKIPLSTIQKYAKNSPYLLTISYQGCSKQGLCYQPMEFNFNSKNNLQPIQNKQLSEQDSIANSLKNSNPFWILVTFFGFGLLLSLTPCIFPMIPILSSIIVSQSGEKMDAKRGFFLSFIYVLAMSLAYAIAGVFAGVFGANIQTALQNPYVLGFFSLIFVLLSLSMFGFYNIELPKSIQNLANKKSENAKGKGAIGVAIMGFLSALIVGPCVAAPLAGALIYIGQSGDALLGGFALFALSFGMGVPLLIIGASAGKFLPRPGIWMDRVKNIFGVVMLGVAIYMIERVIPTSISLILWAILFIFSGVYLNALEPIVSKNRWEKFTKALGVVFLVYGIILFVGGFSGGKSLISPIASVKIQQNINENNELQFITIKNIQELQEIVQNSDKPILLDFWATWCVSCKEMDRYTFSDKDVKNILKEYTLLRADVSKNSIDDKKLLEKFNLFGPPGIVFFNDNEELKHLRVIGFKKPNEFLKTLRQI